VRWGPRTDRRRHPPLRRPAVRTRDLEVPHPRLARAGLRARAADRGGAPATGCPTAGRSPPRSPRSRRWRASSWSAPRCSSPGGAGEEDRDHRPRPRRDGAGDGTARRRYRVESVAGRASCGAHALHRARALGAARLPTVRGGRARGGARRRRRPRRRPGRGRAGPRRRRCHRDGHRGSSTSPAGTARRPRAAPACRRRASPPAIPRRPSPTPTAGSRALPGTTWAVTARPDDLGWASVLVGDLRGTPVPVAERNRTLYHAGLAVGANATTSVVTMARDLLLGAGVDRPGRLPRPRSSPPRPRTRRSTALRRSPGRCAAGTPAPWPRTSTSCARSCRRSSTPTPPCPGWRSPTRGAPASTRTPPRPSPPSSRTRPPTSSPGPAGGPA
jgi:hypothetical protein